MATITIKRAGQLVPGMKFAEVDDDNLMSDDEVNENYNAENLLWCEVTATGGHADIGWVEYVSPLTGEVERTGYFDWDLFVWVYKD